MLAPTGNPPHWVWQMETRPRECWTRISWIPIPWWILKPPWERFHRIKRPWIGNLGSIVDWRHRRLTAKQNNSWSDSPQRPGLEPNGCFGKWCKLQDPQWNFFKVWEAWVLIPLVLGIHCPWNGICDVVIARNCLNRKQFHLQAHTHAFYLFRNEDPALWTQAASHGSFQYCTNPPKKTFKQPQYNLKIHQITEKWS